MIRSFAGLLRDSLILDDIALEGRGQNGSAVGSPKSSWADVGGAGQGEVGALAGGDRAGAVGDAEIDGMTADVYPFDMAF